MSCDAVCVRTVLSIPFTCLQNMTACSSDRPAPIYPSTRCRITEDRHANTQRHARIKLRINVFVAIKADCKGNCSKAPHILKYDKEAVIQDCMSPAADLGRALAKERATCVLLRIEHCISTAVSRFVDCVAGGQVFNKEHSRFLLKMRVTGYSEKPVRLTGWIVSKPRLPKHKSPTTRKFQTTFSIRFPQSKKLYLSPIKEEWKMYWTRKLEINRVPRIRELKSGRSGIDSRPIQRFSFRGSVYGAQAQPTYSPTITFLALTRLHGALYWARRCLLW
jgi:hypothetical protein